MPTQDEYKERATIDLKRVSDTASTATKTAMLGVAALAIIWFSQIRVQYGLLTDDVYPEFNQTLYSQLTRNKTDLRDAIDSLKSRSPQTYTPRAYAVQQSALRHEELVALEKSPTKSKDSSEQITSKEAKGKAQNLTENLQLKISDLESRVQNISFKIFGVELPVPPLWASVVWNAFLLGLLLYLARSRVVVWRLCARALKNLQSAKREYWDDIAGTGAVWIAPGPSPLREKQNEFPRAEDLTKAFGWNRLETLPSIGATFCFLLIILLQLTVTFEGFSTLHRAHSFTQEIMSSPSLGTAGAGREDNKANESAAVFNTSDLKQRLTQLAELAQDPSNKSTSPYLFKQRLLELAVTPEESSLISIFLIVMMAGMFLLSTWWFWPWSVPTTLTEQTSEEVRATDGGKKYREATGFIAARVLIILLVLSVFLIIGWLVPDAVWVVGRAVVAVLPDILRFIGASMAVFCLLQLLLLAISPFKRTSGTNQ